MRTSKPVTTTELNGATWYNRGGRYWYKKPTGPAGAHEKRFCANPHCGQQFFGRRDIAAKSQGRFCSIRCSRRGPWNPQWTGDDATYRAMHQRVARDRGKADRCSVSPCLTSAEGPRAFHWANLTGDHADTSDYASMCVFHHQAYDWARVLGMSPEEAWSRVAEIAPEIQRNRSADRWRSGRAGRHPSLTASVSHP